MSHYVLVANGLADGGRYKVVVMLPGRDWLGHWKPPGCERIERGNLGSPARAAVTTDRGCSDKAWTCFASARNFTGTGRSSIGQSSVLAPHRISSAQSTT